MNYINKWLPQEISEVSTNPDMLNEIADFLSKMMEDYGFNIRGRYEGVMEAITELEVREERRAEAMSGWTDRRAFERSGDDAIDSMFRSLI
jgi:hypothetical protein